MKNKYFKIILLVLCNLIFLSNINAQNISYEVDIRYLYSNECGDCSGDPDYQFWIRLLQGGSVVTNWNPYYEQSCGNIFGTNNSFYSNTNAAYSTVVSLQYDAEEQDNFVCGGNDGDCGGYSAPNGNITLNNLTQNSWQYYTATRGCSGVTWRVYWRVLWNFKPLLTPSTPTSFGSNCGLGLNATASTQTAVQWYWQTSPTGTDQTYAANNPPSVPNGSTTYYLRAYGQNSGLWGPASTGLGLTKVCKFWCDAKTPNPPSIGRWTNVSTGSGWQNNITYNTLDFAANSLIVDVNTDPSNYGDRMQLRRATAGATSLVDNSLRNWSNWDGQDPNVTWRLATDNPYSYTINPGNVSLEVCACKPATYGTISSSTGLTACPGETFTLTHNGSVSNRLDGQGYGEEMRWYSGSCGGSLVGSGLSPSITGPGTETTVKYYARFFTNGNACGGCQEITITYVDNTKPVVVCPGTQADDLDGNCQWSVPDYISSATISDNCVDYDDLIITQSPAAGTLVSSSHGATVSVTITANDGFGNDESCSFGVVMSDVTPPITLCKDYTLVLDALGNGTLTTGNINNGSYDNCTAPSLSLSKTAYTCSDVGANTVTLTGNDGNGNTSTCTAIVTVVDNVNPIAICQNYSLLLDGSGNATLTTANVNNGSNDACGIASLSLSETAFTCSDVGANTVTLTVTDNNSNVSTCTAIVTVIDDVDPNAICQNATVTLDASGTVTVTTAQINNGSTDNCAVTSMSLNPSVYTCADLGTNNAILVVEDAQGNSDFCIGTVTVNQASSTGPTSIMASDSFVCDGAPVTLTQNGGALGTGATYKWYSGSCGGTLEATGSSVIVNPSGTTTYYVRAESVCGDILSSCVSTTINTTITAPGSSTVLATATSSFTCEVTGGNWHHFYNSENELLASINSNSEDLGDVTVEITVGDNGPFGEGLAPGVCGYGDASGGEYVVPRYWDITVEHQPIINDVDVIFYYKNSDVSALASTINGLASDYTACWGDVNVEADLMMTVNHSGSIQTFQSLSFASGPNTSVGQRQIEFSLSEFSGGKLHSKSGMHPGGTLPVELVDFKVVTNENNSIDVEWITVTEINNAGFELQRSTDGIVFNKIAWIEGNGNTNIKQAYGFEDKDVSVGVYYYRLKQIDFDNAFEFSEIKSAAILGKDGLSLSFFIPNPTFNNTQLDFNLIQDEKVFIKVVDNIGRLIDSKEIEMTVGSQTVQFDTEEYSSGLYTAKIIIGKEEFTRRLVVRK